MKKGSPFVSELLNRLEDLGQHLRQIFYCSNYFSFLLESRCVKQERTIEQMQSKILQQEKHIEDLNKHFDDILKECESFAGFMPIFEEKTRKCSESVKTVESELREVRRENSKEFQRIGQDQTSRLDSLATSIDDLLTFKVSNKCDVNFLLLAS